MSAPDKRRNRVSYSGRHPDLSQETPVSFRKTPPLRRLFERARNSLLKDQSPTRKAAQQEQENISGSRMVKRHRPFPELRPKNDLSELRKTFNQDWIKEHRRAALAHMEAQREHEKQENDEPTLAPNRSVDHRR